MYRIAFLCYYDIIRCCVTKNTTEKIEKDVLGGDHSVPISGKDGPILKIRMEE